MSKTQTERRTRTLWWRNRVMVTLALLSMVFAGTVASPSADTAWAKDYPSWGDVMAARHNVAKKNAEISRIQKLLTQLASDQKATEADAIAKGDIYAKAQQAFDDQDYKTQQYQAQADAAQTKADDSIKRAGQMAARLARTGGTDLTATLFFNGDNARNMLSQLGMASKITDQSKGLYDRAIQDQNTAQSLTDQATLARTALEALRNTADAARKDAQAAADKAAAALAEQQKNNATLKAQLATLKTGLVHTEAEYVKGVKEAWGASGAVEISSQGWARPAAGHITSGFGHRVSPCSGCSSYHQGTDIGASCNSPIFAASTGEVVYASWFGGYGNMVEIDHGGGIHTRYGHIVNGGTLVHVGQVVGVGQQIARVGSTGASTGCHLHFEVRINGSAINSVPFMRARGIIIS